jgi:hypothetical protein
VTGKWAVGQDAEELLNLDKEDEEEVSTIPPASASSVSVSGLTWGVDHNWAPAD